MLQSPTTNDLRNHGNQSSYTSIMSTTALTLSDASFVHDPSTYLQRPTSAKTPDISHILTSIFGEIYTKDIISANVIKNLTVSSDVDDEYHKRYVERLKEAQMIKENRIQEYAMLEKHILEARAKALGYEERESERRNRVCDDPDKFGVPPTKSYFSYCLDDSLLREHGLLVPSDYYYKLKPPFVPMPRGEKPESHIRETIASRSRSVCKSSDASWSRSRITPFIDEIEELHKEGSELSDDAKSMVSIDDENLSENEEKNKKPFWKDTLRQESRANCKQELKKLIRRNEFLPNPRLNAAKIASENPQIVIEVNPKFILFNKYVIGKVYESSFEVRNTTTIAHQMRALPPKTPFFSLSLGQYPQGHSIIAPGLSATFNVRFAPDSLCAYEDEILVECSNGSKVIVPLVAKRESPSLSIGSEIDCGKSLVGQIKVCRYLIKNDGGDGRFVILPKSAWPISTFKTNVSSSSLNLYPFEIQPSIFELHKGEMCALEIVFRPPDLKKYEQNIIISCDNCTTIEFKLIGEGELAEIEYVQADESLLNSLSTMENSLLIDEFKDISSSKIIRFPSLNPNVYTRKRIAIKNKSHSPIDYSWLLYKPILEDNLLGNEVNSTKQFQNYSIDKETSFSVAPKQGTLDRNEIKVFEIVFSPSKVGSFHNVAQMILHGIPEINRQLLFGNRDEIHRNSLSKDDMATCDFAGMVVELKGECEPFRFTLDPPAIFVPGSTYMQSTSRKAFRLINMSICSINFNWKQVIEPHIIQVEPSYGEIAPKSYALMDVLITGTKPGKLVDDIPCFVEFADEPIYLHIEADIKGPEATIQEAGLDFGLVQIGNISRSYVTLENISSLPLNWHLSCLEHEDLFEFPPEGYLQPLEIMKIEIAFIPKDEIILNTQFDFKITDGNSLICSCYAQAQRPSASLLESNISIDNIFLGVDHTLVAKLCNHSAIEAEFNWGQPEGEDANSCMVKIEPSSGILKSKSIMDCKITLNSSKLGELNDLRIPCLVQDMLNQLFLTINTQVKGVSVNYYLSNNSDDKSNDLELGDEIKNGSKIELGSTKVGQIVQKSLIIQNQSAIRTNVRMEIKNFKTIENSATSLNKNSYDPLEKPSKFTDKYKLIDNSLGLGFIIDKPNFSLEPFGSVKFSLIALCEMWGSYEDILQITIDGIEQEETIGLELEVVDNPVRLYTGKVVENETDEVSMIRFGSQIQGSGLVKRNLKIQNLSYLPIEIDWKVFLVNKDDEKLIDLNLIFNEINEADLMRMAGMPSVNSNRSQNEATGAGLRNSVLSSVQNSIDSSQEKQNIRGSNSTFEYYDNAYVYVEQLSLIKICLTNHYGSEIDTNNSIFYLNKNTISLKPREKTTIEVVFNTGVDECKDYEAIFVGYFNLAPEHVKGVGFERKIEFNKDPIRFKATGSLDSPYLHVEYNDELNLNIALGDLIQNRNSLVKEQIFKNNFHLLNSSLAPIEFDLKLSKPFYFTNFTNSTEKFILKPKAKQKIEVLFRLDSNFIDDLNFIDSNQVVFEDSIQINFSKNLTQHIPITAKIYGPEITSTKTLLDFGTCLVGQERCQQFAIRNPSNSSCLWNINIENDEHSAFRIDTKSGYLEANKFFVKSCEKIINVYFTAKHDETYNCKLNINIQPSDGKNAMVVDLKGVGSYDQKYEAILNV